MHNNFTYLYKLLLEKYKRNNEKLFMFINYLACYNKQKKNNFFLSLLDLASLKNITNTYKYNYKTYLNEHSFKNTQNIICLDNLHYIFIDLLDDIIINHNQVNQSISINESFNIFYVLNGIMNDNYLYLKIPENTLNNKTIRLINIYSEYFINGIANPKIFIDVGKNSKIKIIESYINFSKNSFINRCLLLNLHEYANVSYYLFNHSNKPLLDTYSLYSFQKEGSKLDLHKKCSGKQTYKGMLNFFLHEKNTLFNLTSLNKLNHDSIYDLECNINHYENNSKSYILFRSVNDDTSKCTFRGNLHIGLDTNKIDSKLYCNSLLVSDNAEIMLIPELNIDNDNIKASHGATVGKIDENMILYLMSRGISRKIAISILINSFLSESTENEKIFSNILNKNIIT